MTLVRLSGSGEAVLGKHWWQKLHNPWEYEREAYNAIKKKLPKIRVATLALAPTRGAFMLAVEANVHGLAKHLLSIYKKRPQEIINLWNNFGGDPNKFIAAIKHGAARRQLLGAAFTDYAQKEYGVGVAPLAALAAATPILIACLSMFHKNKDAMDNSPSGSTSPEQTLDNISNAIQKGKQALLEDQSVSKSVEHIPVDNNGQPVSAGMLPPPNVRGGGSGFFEELQLSPKMMLIGAGLVGVYLITRK